MAKKQVRTYRIDYHYEGSTVPFKQYVEAATAESAVRKFKHFVVARHRVVDKCKLFHVRYLV